MDIVETAQRNYNTLTTSTERTIYRYICIESRKKQKGVSITEIQQTLSKSGIKSGELIKLLKGLEQKQFVTSSLHNNKRMYCMYELGGSANTSPWHISGGFDETFAKNILLTMRSIIQTAPTRSLVTLDYITTQFKKTSSTTLSAADIENVIQCLIYDGAVVATQHPASDIRVYSCVTHEQYDDIMDFRKLRGHLGATLSVTPCITCPNLKTCRTYATINAATCEYLDKWLRGEE